MAEPTSSPTLEEAMKWVGAALGEADGASVGEVTGFFLDSSTGEPVWLIARVGRRRQARLIAVPLRECAGAAFGVWVAQDAETLSTAPVVDPARPLRREHELAICAHFGIGETGGRAAEVARRPEGDVTAVPLGA
ncbi:MAG TPA: PRC-barrel domain-containing protein [Solirubrobacterales bacterium]|jgi:hypothetical protein|nr:PRC-barrel domain-containing protein [Solirubrobacterales bacterium]